MSDQLVSYQDMFHSNNINLTLNYEALSGVQKSRTVFENLVKDKLFDVVGTSGWFTYKEGGTSYAAYVTDNTSQNWLWMILFRKSTIGEQRSEWSLQPAMLRYGQILRERS